MDLAKQRPVGSDVRRQVRSSEQVEQLSLRQAGLGSAWARVCLLLPCSHQSSGRAVSRLPMGRSVQRQLTQKATDAGKSALRVRRPGLWARLVAGFCRGYAILYLEGRGPKLSDAAGAETANDVVSAGARGPSAPPAPARGMLPIRNAPS